MPYVKFRNLNSDNMHLPVFVNIAPYSVLWKSLQHICHYTENKQHNTGWLVISFYIFELDPVEGNICTGEWMKSVVLFLLPWNWKHPDAILFNGHTPAEKTNLRQNVYCKLRGNLLFLS